MPGRGAKARDLAEATGRDEMLHGRERRGEARVVERQEHHAVRAGHRDHLVGVLGRDRHRLVDQDVLSRGRGGDRDVAVKRVRRGDHDGIDIVALDRFLPPIGDDAAPPFVAPRLCGGARPAREHGDVDTGGA